MEEQQPRTPEEARKLNEQCDGAPKYFTYPPDLPMTDEERRLYAEIAARLKVPKRKPRRRRG